MYIDVILIVLLIMGIVLMDINKNNMSNLTHNDFSCDQDRELYDILNKHYKELLPKINYIATYYNYNILSNTSRLAITETLSRIIANNGSVSSVNLLKPYAMIGDAEWDPLIFRVLSIDIEPEKNHVTIQKALVS